ncbi:ectoine/hydroxyectoine ABC transporter substrate-binding protein EhuB, partial [Pseudomonas sp. GW247-3R2A]
MRRLFVACALLGLAASAHAANTLETVKQNSSIRIGYANETPFAYTETDGKVTGESPEIAKAIFEKMGIKKVDGVLTEWGS